MNDTPTVTTDPCLTKLIDGDYKCPIGSFPSECTQEQINEICCDPTTNDGTCLDLDTVCAALGGGPICDKLKNIRSGKGNPSSKGSGELILLIAVLVILLILDIFLISKVL